MTAILFGICVLLVAALAWVFLPKARAAYLSRTAPDIQVISDLDSILSRTVGFKYEGKIFEIPPLSLEMFLLAVQGLATLDHLKTKEDVGIDELKAAYLKLFGVVCPRVTMKIVESMGHQQIAALLNLVIEVIMGKATLDLEKKSQPSSTVA